MGLFGDVNYYDPGNKLGNDTQTFGGNQSTGNWFLDFLNSAKDFLTNPFDITGKNAAAAQFERQVVLDNAARTFNANEAQKQRDWERMMSDTQYQRAVADLKAAGLNPWLALQNGGFSGSTPSGSSASSSSGSSSMANNKSIMVAAGLIATALKMFLKK